MKDQGLTNWKQYDNWKDTTIAGETKFLHHPDGYVDMIYKIHKNHEGHLPQDAGYSQLGLHYQGDFEVDTNHTKISCSQGFGSGITFSYCPSKHIIFNSIFHEHGHNLYSLNHMTYAKVGYGAGYDGFFSPLESILMNYMRPTTVNFASPTNILGDYNSHDTTRGNILKVPIQGNECFLLANRGNVSKWDKVMIGDTATINGPFQDYGDYGKGLYIYHLKDGIRFPIGDEVLQDQECADGLFVWSGAGTAHRYSFDKGYCNDAGMWDFYAKSEVSYDNDTGYGTTLHSDDKSLGMGGQLYSWFGTGKANTNTCLNNTDRQFTTSSNIVTMDKHAGDRYDAWKVGYNEVFSPYSSPSTKTWYNDESGIFVYLKGTNNTSHTDTIKIYSTAEDPEEDILTATPPSRPMGLQVLDDMVSARIKLVWYQNKEPDMIRGGKHRKYNIYKATAGGDTVPTHYNFLTSVLMEEDAPFAEFIDTTTKATCCIPDIECVGGPCLVIYQVRYEITAVDVTDWESMRSDFQGTLGWKWLPGHEGGGGIGEEVLHTNSNIPVQYNLYQNYPNPFNPTTNIVYDLPKDGLITISVYDILGREIKTLINEFKRAGSYLIPFEGKEFSSGVYFYRIVSNNFIQTKRMILMK